MATAVEFLAAFECEKGVTYDTSTVASGYATANQFTIRTEGCMISINNTVAFEVPIGETHKLGASLKFKVTNKNAIITIEKG